MRGFAQTLFSALLGWIRTLVEGVWDILFSSDAQQWLRWVGDNWMVLLVFLCLCGVALDYIVWFFRWRPYYVWGSSMRKVRRIFGGEKNHVREDAIRPRADSQQASTQFRRRDPEPVYQNQNELMYDDSGYENERAWQNEQYAVNAPYEQPDDQRQMLDYQIQIPDDQEPILYETSDVSYQQQPTTVFQKPAATADTILARPRKADYQEQYVRRFARPESEPANEPVYANAQKDEWNDNAAPYEPAEQEAYWAPEIAEDAADQPIHPGIDYQAMSRQYGWHIEKQDSNQKGTARPAQLGNEQLEDQAWDFSGMDNFSPYRSPEVPASYIQRSERNERAKKQKTDNSSFHRVKRGLSRIAQRASKVLTVDDDQSGKLIDGLPPPIDKRRAFHAPVYPNRPGNDKQKSPDFQEDD